MIKIQNSNQEPPVSSETPYKGLKDIEVLCNFKITTTSQVNLESQTPMDAFSSQHSQRKKRTREHRIQAIGNPINSPGQDRQSSDSLQSTFAGLSNSDRFQHSAHDHQKADGQLEIARSFPRHGNTLGK